MRKENIKTFCAPEMSDHAGLVNLKFLSRGVLKLSKICMLFVKPYNIVYYRQHIVLLSALFWYKKNCTAITKLNFLCLLFSQRGNHSSVASF